MSQYHFSAQVISRADGRSSVKAAAYRAGEKLIDERTSEVCNYPRKKVLGSAIFLPNGQSMDRAKLWNAVEAAHKRGDAVVAREFNIAFPLGLTQEEREALAFEYAEGVAKRYNVAADACLHPPDKVTENDLKVDPDRFKMPDGKGGWHNGNWHFHVQLSACYVNEDGTMGKKCVELDPIHMQRVNAQRKKEGLEPLLNAVEFERKAWADLCNQHLEKAGLDLRVDHRSFADQGIVDHAPTTHHGAAARATERKTGKKSDRRLADEAAQQEWLKARAIEAAQAKILKAQILAAENLVDELQEQAAVAARALIFNDLALTVLPPAPAVADEFTKGEASPQKPLPAQSQATAPAQKKPDAEPPLTREQLDTAWNAAAVEYERKKVRLESKVETFKALKARIDAPARLAQKRPFLAFVDAHAFRVKEFEQARQAAAMAASKMPALKAEIEALKPEVGNLRNTERGLFKQLQEAAKKEHEAHFAAKERQRLDEQRRATKLANAYSTAERQKNNAQERPS